LSNLFYVQEILSLIDRNSELRLDKIRSFTDSIHYVLPKLLLIATALDEELVGNTPGKASVQVKSGSVLEEIPLGAAEGTIKVQMVDPEQAEGRVKELFKAIKQRHDHPGVASYYRALGNWPDFLEAAWKHIEPHVDSGAYQEHKQVLIKQAKIAIEGLTPMEATTATRQSAFEESRDDIQSVLAVFRYRLIPDLLLDVTLIKAMLNGRDAARSSRFSATN
jgi:hypothetical protein